MTIVGSPVIVLALALVSATPLVAQQHQLRTEWSKNVTEFRSQNGRRVTLVCPSGGSIGDLWGTDSYTDDSSVCTAAVHAGLITAEQGGVVTIVIAPGQKSYAGSHRNGVTAKGFGSTNGSFTFERGTGEGRVDWSTSAVGLSLVGRPLTVVCPAGAPSREVWGTDTYTEDSSICLAGVHAGVITLASGGRLTLTSAPGQATYAGNERNGVTSRPYTNFDQSFTVSGAGAPAAVAQVGTVAPTPATSVAPVATTAPSQTSTPGTTATTPLRAPVGVAPQTAGLSTPVSGATTTTVIGDRAPVARTAAGGVTTGLLAPTGVTAQPLYYRGTVMVRWDTVPGATGYDILQRLPDGRYAGANPIDRGTYGPERSQGITMELAAVPISLSVVAHYAEGQASPPSAPASVVIPRWYGRYRISILGFKVERETSDDPLETDGKRDEVYLRAAAAERGPDGELIGSIVQRQTLVHGDINLAEWRNSASPNHRIKAGSASADGGLRTGDAFPTATPWQRSTSSNFANTLPLLLWEGDLIQGHNTVQVAFNLWESDQRPGQTVPTYADFSPEAAALERVGPSAKRLEPSVAGQVVTATAAGIVLAPTLAPLLVLSAPALVPSVAIGMAAGKVMPRLPVIPKVETPISRLEDEIGLTAASLHVTDAMQSAVTELPNTMALAVTDFLNDQESHFSMLLNVKDRPLGVFTGPQAKLTAIPNLLTLNFENAESQALAGNGPSDKGSGIYEYRLVDKVTDTGGNGIYVVYLQVQRLQ